MHALLYVAMLYTFNSVNECLPRYDCCGPPCIVFCHTLGLSLVPQQILHYFQLVISGLSSDPVQKIVMLLVLLW